MTRAVAVQLPIDLPGGTGNPAAVSATHTKRRALGALGCLLAVGCSEGIPRSRFASWDPISDAIPQVKSREVALARLARSRRYWDYARTHENEARKRDASTAIGAPRIDYTYVRTRQLSPERVQFTVIGVEGERIVARGLLEAKADQLQRLGSWVQDHPELMPASVYKELGASIGSHSEGAPPLRIEQLYDQCETEIRRRGVRPIRMYFHPSGVLMQCGRTKGECRDCPAVSIQSYSVQSILPQALEFEPSHWTCSADWGLLPPGVDDWVSGRRYECLAPELQSERITRLRKQKEDCMLCECGWKCDLTFDWAFSRPANIEPCPIEFSVPDYLDVGKADPDAPFTFHGVSNAAIDCSGPNRAGPLVRALPPPVIDP